MLGPEEIGTLWAGFAVPDCTDRSGDPIVLYDQTEDRWILSQFTTRGLNVATPTAPFVNTVSSCWSRPDASSCWVAQEEPR